MPKDELNSFGCNDSICLHVWYWHFYARHRIFKIIFFWTIGLNQFVHKSAQHTHITSGEKKGLSYLIRSPWGQLFFLLIYLSTVKPLITVENWKQYRYLTSEVLHESWRVQSISESDLTLLKIWLKLEHLKPFQNTLTRFDCIMNKVYLRS